jgi:hypothetical protein
MDTALIICQPPTQLRFLRLCSAIPSNLENNLGCDLQKRRHYDAFSSCLLSKQEHILRDGITVRRNLSPSDSLGTMSAAALALELAAPARKLVGPNHPVCAGTNLKLEIFPDIPPIDAEGARRSIGTWRYSHYIFFCAPFS